MGVNIALRDQAEFGGSTAGLKTAYHSDRNHKNDSGVLDNRVVVEGGLVATVYQHISKTGIHSVNEYLGVNNNYYTVEYTPDDGSAVKYVSTYDGKKDSAYPAGTQDLRYDLTSKKLQSDGDTLLKERAGKADNTLAGVNSGAVYNGSAIDGAFAYSDTIEIPSAIKSGTPATGGEVTYQPVYVPMSYFGSLSALVGRKDSGEVAYYEAEFVGYDIANGTSADLKKIDRVLTSMTLSDGTYEWSGASIGENPYINIGTFDWYHDNDETTNSLTLLNDQYSRPYYNNRLAVLTVDSQNALLGYEKFADEFVDNRNSFVGDGRLMYLEDQATKLIEHNFGLTFTKKNVRTSTRSLTLRIDLVRYSDNKVAVNNDGAIEDEDRCTAEIKIHVENTKMDLYNSADNSSTVKYDNDKGTYYVDLTLPSSGSASYTLSRKATSAQAASTDRTIIEYYDDDYGTADKRDYAYFSSDSFVNLSQWQTREAGYNRALKLTDDETKFVNVIETDKAQSSVANYFGGMSNVSAVDGSYIPNGGKYGVTGREGYSGYFSASVTDGGVKLNIMPIRKTFINDIAFDMVTELKTIDRTSQTAVAAAYEKRGLVALYNDSTVSALNPSRVYYPFKVLIYDSFGVGFTDASYVAMEFRITITNGDPTLKAVGEENAEGRQYTMNLAVSNSASINLYDIVYDSDIFTYEVGVGVGRLATEDYFKDPDSDIGDLARETGDYLDSPLDHDIYKDGNPGYTKYEPNNVSHYTDGERTVYYRNGGGFVDASEASIQNVNSDYNERDVIMWMTTNDNGNPSSNIIMFKVNRRTTALDGNGKSISVNQYRFTLRFYDGAGARTAPFTFIINIANQAPSVTLVDRSFTMRKGDDMTLLTSYYDVFTDNNSIAYQKSETIKLFEANHEDLGYGSSYGDGYNNATGFGTPWVFGNITTANAGEGDREYSADGKLHHDSTSNTSGSSVHLGYVGLASDDTPWRLRIIDWTKTSDRYEISTCRLALRPEGGTSASAAYQIAICVTARAACVNEPLTVTISDGEGGIITCTLYITIVSSPPVARDYGNTATDKPALDAIGVEGVSDGHDGYLSGEFMTFVVPADGVSTFNDIDGFEGAKKARRVTTITMSGIANDPDGRDETDAMRLYGNGEFAMGADNVPLVCSADGIYHTPYFDIQPSNDGRSFTITATGYNPDTTSGYELLTFRVADYGDSSYENTIVIKLRIYTMYSDMTNPSVASLNADAYKSYLAGADVVNVKSYDTYYDPAHPVDVSRYAFVGLEDNVGNDGNDKSPIVDPDAKIKGDASYSARLYAFINVQEDGTVKALPTQDIDAMLVRNGSTKTFGLKADGDYAKYMIGGIVDGSSVEPTHEGGTRLSAILKYASFEFTSDGTALLFTPNASTLESPEILLYVEAEKPGSQRNSYKRTSAVLKAGSLFRLNVLDSAPQEVGGQHAAEGRKGDVATFTVFDPDDRYGALFMDSDRGDKVTVFGIGSDGKLSDVEYNNVMSVAEQQLPGLDWKADADAKKPRAFDISVGDDGELQIKINRRVDYTVAGEYQSSVTIPLKISGVDAVGQKASTVVYLTVNNTDLTAVNYFEKYDEATLVGYSFNIGDDGNYVMNVKLRYDVPLEVNLVDILKDNDSAGEQYDADSFRFVNPITGLAGGYNYITDKEIDVNWYALDSDGNPNVDYTEKLAVAEPVGPNEFHRTGIRFTATATKRDLTATVYVRVIDRAGHAEIEENGIIIKINVIVMNDAPYTISGMETTTLYMVGSETETPAGMLFFIGDFVADKNESDVVGDAQSAINIDTCLRISLQESRVVKEIYSPSFEKLPEGLGFTDEVYSSALFEVTIPSTLDDALLDDYRTRMNKGADFYKDAANSYNQWFVVRPRRGFYGEGAVDITVVDGNANVKYDTLSTTFCLEVHVISNPDEVIDGMADVEIACSKTKQIDIRSLMPDMENKLKIDVVDAGQDAEVGGVATSADEAATFNQYEYYEIVGMGFQNEIDESKATFTKLDEGGQIWELKAGNQTTRDPVRVAVDFALKYDKTRTYRKYFYLNIIANRSPQIKYNAIEFKRHNSGEADSLSDLNEANSVRLEPWQLCVDADDPEGTAIRFVDVKSQVGSIVKAQLIKDENGEYRYLELTFVARGESEITLTVTDETGAPVQLKFMAGNKDLPEASMWVKIAASFEANPVMWIIIICCALLLIVILIIIIAVARKRKRAKEELEALLVSEMEIEEQMLRLAGGPSPTNYQSYGYLQGAPAQPDSSMMLGAGADAPQPQLTALPPAQEGATHNIDDGGNGSDGSDMSM
ncbi:MAG: hypothetical protein K2O04_03840 [Clostridiales bacterium]|nr:hypothetical protein [Clostridiales bacterium]